VISDVENTQARLALVAALRQALRSAFEILGVSAPDRMDSSAEAVPDEA
jgi:arginyl-tRNA synthetase